MFDQLTEAHKKLNQNVNPTLVFEQIVIKGQIQALDLHFDSISYVLPSVDQTSKLID
jgi:hypothetical protein